MHNLPQRLPSTWALMVCLLLPELSRGESAVEAWVQRYNGGSHDCARAVAVDGSNNVIVTGYSTGSGSALDYLTIKYSSTGIPLWTNRYNGPGNDEDRAMAVVVDGNNDAIVTGYSTGSGSALDYATIKYSSDGVPLWTNRYNGPGSYHDYARAVAVDGSNNLIVTGYSYGSLSALDYATIKYSSDGVPLWTNLYNGPGNYFDYANALAVDSSNNVIITGTSNGNSTDYATIKYSADGVSLWTNRYTGAGNNIDSAWAVALDRSNNVVVSGWSTGSNSFDCATIKYSSDGVPLWTNRYNGPGQRSDRANAVAVDGNNDVIVAGFTGWSTGTGGFYDYATIKYSGAGLPLWTNRYSGPVNKDDFANALAVDGGNNVIVTGDSLGPGGSDDYATIKYSSAGLPLWERRYSGPGASIDVAWAVAVDRSGNVIVTGIGGHDDFTTIKYICVPEPVLTGLQLANGAFQIRVDEVLQPGTLVVEASTDLPDWLPVFTNTTTTNVVFYTDPGASNYLRRFYRAFQSP